MQAILLALAGFFSFTLMDLSIKWLLQSYSLMQVTFFNCFFGMVGLFVWIYPRVELLKTKQIKIHLIRATLILVADLLAFYSYGQVPLAEAYTLILTMPVFTAVFALLFKHEPLNPLALVVTFIGFSGVYLMLSPRFGHFHWALVAALLCAIIESISFLLVGHYRAQETPQAFAFYGLSLVTLSTGIAMLWSFKAMPLTDIGISMGGGVCYALASALVISAFHRGSPIMVSSMQYSQLIWGALLSFMIWHEVPSQRVLLGGLLVTIAGLALLHSQRRKALSANTTQAPQH
ncbi:DMT family transporter [Thiofilum flexile]|uniref:DMT family transporter n=1 Tax=Thiofilum flexile TaxID=125627 RepID=UPI00036774DE|nr:DMT family transporter [Thiofilum flexile]